MTDDTKARDIIEEQIISNLEGGSYAVNANAAFINPMQEAEIANAYRGQDSYDGGILQDDPRTAIDEREVERLQQQQALEEEEKAKAAKEAEEREAAQKNEQEQHWWQRAAAVVAGIGALFFGGLAGRRTTPSGAVAEEEPGMFSPAPVVDEAERSTVPVLEAGLAAAALSAVLSAERSEGIFGIADVDSDAIQKPAMDNSPEAQAAQGKANAAMKARNEKVLDMSAASLSKTQKPAA